MNIILLGPPGVGKGTEAGLLSARLSIFHVSTGNMLRQEVRENTELGEKARSFMNEGKLVPDEVIMAMVKKRLSKVIATQSEAKGKQSHKGFVLDGVPRTLNQAEVLEEILKDFNSSLDFVIELEAKEEVLIKRLSGRRVCPKCHALYHITSMKPKKEGVCDRCGEELYQRDDDKVETIKRRLKIYEEETQGLREFYRKKGIFLTVNADREVEETYNNIAKNLKLKTKNF